MDYCSSCRRHLNGALACPGCGAYAPDIAPATTGTAPAWEAPPSDTWQSEPGDDLTPVPSAPQGRAARRRQRARWKKNQRRAVVATAVALVGGGLTVSAMNQRSGDRAQAATAPESTGTDTGRDTDTGTAEISATSYTRPTATRPDTRLSYTPSAPERPHRQHAAAPPLSTPSNVRPDAAAPPRTTTTSAPQSQPASPTPEATVPDSSTPEPAQTPAPTATDPSPETPPTSPAPATTSPTQICLLVICLG